MVVDLLHTLGPSSPGDPGGPVEPCSPWREKITGKRLSTGGEADSSVAARYTVAKEYPNFYFLIKHAINLRKREQQAIFNPQ